jgi:hypothetical protein
MITTVDGRPSRIVDKKTIEEFLDCFPYYIIRNNQIYEQLEVSAFLIDGRELELKNSLEVSSDDQQEIIKKPAKSIKNQISGFPVSVLKLCLKTKENPDITEIIPLIEPDWESVRSKVSKIIRETKDMEKLHQIAMFLSVKLHN